MAHETNYGTGENRLEEMHKVQHPGGVVVDPLPITSGDVITILYNGILAKSGAQEIYLHAGYGRADNWEDVTEERMSRTGWGFVKTMEVKNYDQLNFCFRDNAYNWDNNNGLNWSFQIHNGRI